MAFNTNFDLEPENLGDILSQGTNMLKAPDRSFSFYDTVTSQEGGSGSMSDTIPSNSGASCGAFVADTVVGLLEPPQATVSEPAGIPDPAPQASSRSGMVRHIDANISDQGEAHSSISIMT